MIELESFWRSRPEAGEHDAYYLYSIDRVPSCNVVDALESQLTDTLALLATVTDQQADRAYAPGKWTLKQVIGHVIDTERVFAYRALAFSRGERQPLPGFEQDEWAASGGFAHRLFADQLSELQVVRAASVALFRGLDPESARRSGIADGKTMSVRAAAYVIAGHELHHRAVIEERYL